MKTDKEIAARALDMQSRGRNVPLTSMPAYVAWSERKLEEGVSFALIAHLDAMNMALLPEEISEVDEVIFDELLSELRADVEKQG